MRNEQRLFLQLVVGMIVAMCQGSVFCFSLFGPALKAPPFNYKESQMNIISGTAAVASFFSLPFGLTYDFLGQRVTYLSAFILVGGGWILLYFLVFKQAEDYLLAHQNNTHNNLTDFSNNNYNNNNNNLFFDFDFDTNDNNNSQYPSHLILVTAIFSVVMSGATALEMSVMMSNLDAFQFHHGWLVVVLKTLIGIGSSAIALTQAAFFVSKDDYEKSKLAGEFCLYLGCYSASVSLLGAIFTSHPFSSDYEAREKFLKVQQEREVLENRNNNNNIRNDAADDTSSTQQLLLDGKTNQNEKKMNIPAAPFSSQTTTSSHFKSKPNLPYISFLSRWWDIRVIGINCQPPSSYAPSSSLLSTSSSRHDFHTLYKPLMSRGLWILLTALIIVIAANSVELGAGSVMPQWSFILIAMIVMSIPLMFLSFLFMLPGVEFHPVPENELLLKSNDDYEDNNNNNYNYKNQNKSARSDNFDDSRVAHSSFQEYQQQNSEASINRTSTNNISSANNSRRNTNNNTTTYGTTSFSSSNNNNNNSRKMFIETTSRPSLNSPSEKDSKQLTRSSSSPTFSPKEEGEQPQGGENNFDQNHYSSLFFLLDLEGEGMPSSFEKQKNTKDHHHHHHLHDHKTRINKLSPIQNKLRLQGSELMEQIIICSPLLQSSSGFNNKNNNPSSLSDQHQHQNQKQQNNENNNNTNNNDKNNNFSSAIQYFSEALSLSTEENNSNPHNPNNALLYSNRSAAYCARFASHQSGNNNNNNNNAERNSNNETPQLLQLALQDADSSIKSDRSWWKGYWRRGIVLELMGKFDSAKKAYELALSKFDDMKKPSASTTTTTTATNEDENNSAVIATEKKIRTAIERCSSKKDQTILDDSSLLFSPVSTDKYHNNNVVTIENSNNQHQKKQSLLALWRYDYKTEDEKPFRIRVIESIETQFLQGQPLRRMTLLDLEDDYNEEPPQNGRNIISNLYHHPIDFMLMWVMFFGLWGSTVMIYSNVYSIYYALQGEDFTFTSARNAIFVSIFGVGNAAGRALAGLCVPLLQGRSRPIWILLRVSPILNMFGLSFFLVSQGAGLAVPFLVCGLATGFTWGSTIIVTKRLFQLPGSHYAFFYTAGIAGIVAFNIGLFSSVYEHEVHRQQEEQQHQHGHQNEPMNFTTTTTTMMTTTFSPSSSPPPPTMKHHCVGLECVEVSILIVILANFIALICAEIIIRRFNKGSIDSGLSTTMMMNNNNNDNNDKNESNNQKKQIVEFDTVQPRASDYAFRYDEEEDDVDDDDSDNDDIDVNNAISGAQLGRNITNNYNTGTVTPSVVARQDEDDTVDEQHQQRGATNTNNNTNTTRNNAASQPRFTTSVASAAAAAETPHQSSDKFPSQKQQQQQQKKKSNNHNNNTKFSADVGNAEGGYYSQLVSSNDAEV